MTFRVPAHAPDGRFAKWFTNSAYGLDEIHGWVNPFEFDKIYESTYNVKLIEEKRLETVITITHIEFPTEEDAIMFLLRWS